MVVLAIKLSFCVYWMPCTPSVSFSTGLMIRDNFTRENLAGQLGTFFRTNFERPLGALTL